MDWQFKLVNQLEEYNIRELYLYQLPILKTCDNWMTVQEIASVRFKGKHANYYGGLVKYAEKIYFVPEVRLNALLPYRKWKFKKTINILKEEDVLAKKKK